MHAPQTMTPALASDLRQAAVPLVLIAAWTINFVFLSRSASSADKDLWCTAGDKMAHLKHTHLLQEVKKLPSTQPGPRIVVWGNRVLVAFLTEVAPETLAVHVMENATHVDEAMNPMYIFNTKTSTAYDSTPSNQWGLLKIISGKRQSFRIRSNAQVQMALTPEKDGLVVVVDGVSSSGKGERRQVLHCTLSIAGHWETSVMTDTQGADSSSSGGEGVVVKSVMDLTRIPGTLGGGGDSEALRQPSLLKATLSVIHHPLPQEPKASVTTAAITLERFTDRASIMSSSVTIDSNHTAATLQLPANVRSVSKVMIVPPEATLAAILPGAATYVLCHVFVVAKVYRKSKSDSFFHSVIRLDVTFQEGHPHALTIALGGPWASDDAPPVLSRVETMASAASVHTAAAAGESTLFVGTSSHITFDTLHVTTSKVNKLVLVRLDERGRVRKGSECVSVLSHAGLLKEVSAMVPLGSDDGLDYAHASSSSSSSSKNSNDNNTTSRRAPVGVVSRTAIVAYTRYFEDRLSLHVAVVRVG